jgi:hypothetical protein
LVYIIFLLLFPILTRHAPSFGVVEKSSSKKKNEAHAKLDTVQLPSIKACHHLLPSRSLLSLFLGGHAVNEKWGSRKRAREKEMPKSGCES